MRRSLAPLVGMLRREEVQVNALFPAKANRKKWLVTFGWQRKHRNSR
jgi:hypothetical protein